MEYVPGSASEELYPVSSIRCSSCGCDVYYTDEFKYCPMCGAKIDSLPRCTVEDVFDGPLGFKYGHCSLCGAKIRADSAYCGCCGADVIKSWQGGVDGE